MSKYDADALEGKIDNARMQRNWGNALKSIEKYAHVFAVGVAVHSRQNADINIVRSYYWTVVAEILMEKKKDYLKAYGCIKKAYEIAPNCDDWRILLVRLLLIQISPMQLSPNSNADLSVDSKQNDESTSNGDTISLCDQLSIADPAEYDASIMLEDTFQVINCQYGCIIMML